MSKLYLHTGTNLGNRSANLQQARELAEREIGPIISASRIYRTKAWGITEQPDFLNQALLLETNCSPLEVLNRIKAIEHMMGRVRVIKWGARLIDIDILFYDDKVIRLPQLQIPHPHLQERNFVLKPLMDIAPGLVHPIFQQTIAELFARSADTLGVELLEEL